jgi:hypothetical protein
MPPALPMCGLRRGGRRRFWIALVVLPAVTFLLAILWLASPLGRGWIATRIQHITGLETRVGGVSVSPWNGIRIDRVELLQPAPLRTTLKEPLASIQQIRLIPVWRAWLRGRSELQSIEFDSPRLVIATELLQEIARSRTPATPVGPPVTTAASPTVQQPATPAAAPPTTQAPPPAVKVPMPPTAWLHLKNASFSVISITSGNRWLDLSGVTGSIPIAGSPAQSSLHLRSLLIAENEVLAATTASLEWQAPMLSLKPLTTTIHPFQMVTAGKIGLLSGLPLHVEMQAPRQKLETLHLPNHSTAAADFIAANARFRGFLLAPTTWQGEFTAETLAPSAQVAGHNVRFDRGSAVTVLRGGQLSCVDARLIGDDLSLLGNGTLLADGRIAAALRLVAPPENASAIATRIFTNLPQAPSLTELSTPQRSAFDLQVFGNIRRIFLKLGAEGPVMEMRQPGRVR